MSGSSNVEAPSARQTHYSSSKAHFMNGQTKQHSSGLSKKALEESDLSDLASVRSRPKRSKDEKTQFCFLIDNTVISGLSSHCFGDTRTPVYGLLGGYLFENENAAHICAFYPCERDLNSLLDRRLFVTEETKAQTWQHLQSAVPSGTGLHCVGSYCSDFSAIASFGSELFIGALGGSRSVLFRIFINNNAGSAANEHGNFLSSLSAFVIENGRLCVDYRATIKIRDFLINTRESFLMRQICMQTFIAESRQYFRRLLSASSTMRGTWDQFCLVADYDKYLLQTIQNDVVAFSNCLESEMRRLCHMKHALKNILASRIKEMLENGPNSSLSRIHEVICDKLSSANMLSDKVSCISSWNDFLREVIGIDYAVLNSTTQSSTAHSPKEPVSAASSIVSDAPIKPAKKVSRTNPSKSQPSKPASADDLLRTSSDLNASTSGNTTPVFENLPHPAPFASNLPDFAGEKSDHENLHTASQSIVSDLMQGSQTVSSNEEKSPLYNNREDSNTSNNQSLNDHTLNSLMSQTDSVLIDVETVDDNLPNVDAFTLPFTNHNSGEPDESKDNEELPNDVQSVQIVSYDESAGFMDEESCQQKTLDQMAVLSGLESHNEEDLQKDDSGNHCYFSAEPVQNPSEEFSIKATNPSTSSIVADTLENDKFDTEESKITADSISEPSQIASIIQPNPTEKTTEIQSDVLPSSDIQEYTEIQRESPSVNDVECNELISSTENSFVSNDKNSSSANENETKEMSDLAAERNVSVNENDSPVMQNTHQSIEASKISASADILSSENGIQVSN